MVSGRQTADERRTAVLAAAISEFARSGYAGTSTEAIAARAGISQPYLFRLFGTKKDLFVATYDLVGDRIIRELTLAGEGLGRRSRIAGSCEFRDGRGQHRGATLLGGLSSGNHHGSYCECSLTNCQGDVRVSLGSVASG